MLHEIGVGYTHDPKEAEQHYYLQPFTVNWFHFPTNTQGTRTVYCEKKLDVLILVNNWNRISLLHNQNKVVWLYIVA
jgi:hypothetical protein